MNNARTNIFIVLSLACISQGGGFVQKCGEVRVVDNARYSLRYSRGTDPATGDDTIRFSTKFQAGWTGIALRNTDDVARGGMYGLEITTIGGDAAGLNDYEIVATDAGGKPAVRNQTSFLLDHEITDNSWTEASFWRYLDRNVTEDPIINIAYSYGPGSIFTNTWTIHQHRGSSNMDLSICNPIPPPTPQPTASPPLPTYTMMLGGSPDAYSYLVPALSQGPLRNICFTGSPCMTFVLEMKDDYLPEYLLATGKTLTLDVSIGGVNGTGYDFSRGEVLSIPGTRFYLPGMVATGSPGTISFVFTLKESGVVKTVLTQQVYLEDNNDGFYERFGRVFIGVPLVQFSESDFQTAAGMLPLTVMSAVPRDVPASLGLRCGATGVEVAFNGTQADISTGLKNFLLNTPMCATYVATSIFTPISMGLVPGTHATSRSSFLYLNSDNWDTLCVANLTCQTISMKMEHPLPNLAGTCIMTVNGGLYSVPLNHNSTCQFLDIVIPTAGVFTLNIKLSARGYTGSPFKAILTVKNTIDGKPVSSLDDVVSYVRVRGGFDTSSVPTTDFKTFFGNVVGGVLGMPSKEIVVSRVSSAQTSERQFETLAVDIPCSSTTETDITWKLTPAALSTDPSAYTRFMSLALDPSHQLFKDLCGVSETYRKWELAAVDPVAEPPLKSVVAVQSPTVYSYLQGEKWLCLNKLECSTMVLKITNATEAAALLAQYPSSMLALKAIPDNPNYVAVPGSDVASLTDLQADGRGNSFMFHDLEISGPNGEFTLQFFLVVNGAVQTGVVFQHVMLLASVDFTVERIIKTVIRMDLESFASNKDNFVNTLGKHLNLPTELSMRLQNITSHPIVASRAQTLSAMTCTQNATSGTEISWYLLCTLANATLCPDKQQYYDAYFQGLSNTSGPLDAMLCGVDQSYGSWYKVVPRTPSPSSDDENSSVLWIILILALLFLCCAIAVFLFAIRRREERKRQMAERTTYNPEEMGPVPDGTKAPMYAVNGFGPPPAPAPSAPFYNPQGHYQDNGAMPPVVVSPLEPVAMDREATNTKENEEEIEKLQREINKLENQKRAMDEMAREALAEDEDEGIEVGKVGATASQLQNFAPMRIAPDGRIPVPPPERGESATQQPQLPQDQEIEFSDSEGSHNGNNGNPSPAVPSVTVIPSEKPLDDIENPQPKLG
eukprot:TRINITY_DN22938_c0_g1_i1.p1 TRINITY_DN22938_c0_g1~~TRINITY_DN22938_c0_g1_i1.p1  ORF type:complete len:1176 (+),score=170.58 TRINITY_DN22938_c0_g1_i1:54-3581(+)